jgi:stage II sporulation protein D
MEFLCKWVWGEIRDLKNRRISRAIPLALLLLFVAACGRHKAQVPPPVLKQPPAPTQAGSPTPKPAPPTPPAPPVQEKAAGIAVRESVAQTPAQSTAESELSAGPLIRIGLTTEAKEIRISSAQDYYVSEKKAESPQLRVQGEIRVRLEQEVDEKSEVFRVQVASFANMDSALDLKRKLSEEHTEPVVINENTGAGVNQVRVGEFLSRDEAQAFQKILAKSGYPDCFVIKEAVAAAGGGTVLALRGQKNVFRLSRSGFLIQPSSRSSFISFDGKPYRGLFDISLNKSGRITVVNQVGIEEYLLGVVPAEISPTTYPESAALAAQSIAARTYALFHIGRYRAEGFDLTDDTRTQVYEGAAAEKSATSEAVRQTAGLAIYYQGKVIDAMFMSTCGGRTEDFANVFDSGSVPYLKSVFCAIESGPEKGETVIQGNHILEQIIVADDGSIANRNLELAHTLGIMGTETNPAPDFLAGAAEKAELLRWVEAAARIAQKDSPGTSPPRPPDLQNRVGFLQYAAEVFFGSAEIKRRISPRDAEYYIGNLKDGNAVPESSRMALAYLIRSGLLRPLADNTLQPNAPVRRNDALSILTRCIESARPEILRRGTFVSAGSMRREERTVRSINVKWGNKTQEFPFSDDPPLFRLDMGRTTPVSALRVLGNERLAFHVNPQGSIDFLEIELSPAGAANDRYSPMANWDTTLSRSTIAEKLRGLTGNIGEFRDLTPSKIGESGRAVRIQVIGSRGSVDLNGYKVRNALGLKDTLFSITREYNPEGAIASFTFHGRGYGHGVGLCQVGAFGMARAGKGYEEILKTYYQGVQIRKAY